MKIIKTGWVARSDFKKGRVPWVKDPDTQWETMAIYKTKGTELIWAEQDWPPVKVKVTIEKVNHEYKQ